MSTLTTEGDLLLMAEPLQVVTGEVGLPTPLLEALYQLAPCDLISFNRMDSVARAHAWQQEYDGVRTTLFPAQADAEDDPFWQHYWRSPCSLCDRTGDLASVTLTGDVESDREYHASPMYVEYLAQFPVEHEMMMVLPDGGPGRTLRLLFSRGRGSGFTERDRFYLQLLRPHIARAFARGQAAQHTTPGLTRRQVDILGHVRLGRTNHQIGRRLGISEGTVRTHLRDIFERLDVSSRTAAVLRAEEVLGAPPVAAADLIR